MADGPRYAFHPLERRGLLLGLDAGQLLTVAASVFLAVAAHAALGGAMGLFLGVVVTACGLVAALWTRGGSSLGAQAVTGLAWVFRRPHRSVLDDAPTAGHIRWKAHAEVSVRRDQRPKTCPAGIELIKDGGLPGEGALGVVRDHKAGTWAAAMPVRGCSFSLLDPSEQAQRLDGWRRVLDSVGRPGSPVVRLQWIQRSWSGPSPADLDLPESDAAVFLPPPDARPSAAAPDPSVSYRRMAASAAQAMVHHHAWLLVAVRPSHPQLRGPVAASQGITNLRRELRLLGGQLRDAELDPLEPLDLDQLGGLITGPGTRTRMTSSRAISAWPLAAKDGWSTYRADGVWHATYWIAEWPRVQVGPDFLAPLLVGQTRTTVAVTMAPVPPDRAMREVRSARTADLADAQLRARAGFLQSARRDRETEGVTRREAELADGHHEFRFSGYVTVTAEDPEKLTAACAATEHAAASARMELRRLFGRQAEALSWTLPLGRGLR